MLSVTCLATDASLTADPGAASSIPAGSHTFVEIDHEIISTVILLSSAESFKKVCCQLQAKVCARSTGLTASSSLPRKKVWLGELTVPPLTWDVKQQNKLCLYGLRYRLRVQCSKGYKVGSLCIV